jgi:hypothetical protein
MTEEENKVYVDKLEQSAMDALHMSCDEMDQDEQLKYMKVAKTQLEVAEALKPKETSWWNRPLGITVKDVVLGLAAPIAGLLGAVYTANSRRDEANLNLEAKRLECDAQVKCEQIRATSRLEQLKLITKSEELPDNYSLKVLNENNK